MDGDAEFVARWRANIGRGLSVALIMARGWESKSIEDQQAEKERAALEAHRVQLSPAAIARQQRVEALRLSRSQLQNQLDLARNEMHRQMLLGSLQALETELAQLEKE